MELRRVGLISVVVLLAQFLLGTAANLWVTIEAKTPWSHIGNSALFATHGALGVAIALMAFVVLGKAFEDRSTTATRTSAVLALVGVLGALGCGIGFVESGGAPSFSFGMALGWALALFANVCLALGS